MIYEKIRKYQKKNKNRKIKYSPVSPTNLYLFSRIVKDKIQLQRAIQSSGHFPQFAFPEIAPTDLVRQILPRHVGCRCEFRACHPAPVGDKPYFFYGGKFDHFHTSSFIYYYGHAIMSNGKNIFTFLII
jgi:hypothetical protein